MHAEPKELLKTAIVECLPLLQAVEGDHATTQWTWHKNENGGWSGQQIMVPNPHGMISAAKAKVSEASARFYESLEKYHADFVGLVGLVGYQMRVPEDAVLYWALLDLWHRHGTFAVDATAVEGIVAAVEDFYDRPTARVRFRSTLLKFTMQSDAVELPNGTRIRRLSEAEVSQRNPLPMSASGNWRYGVSEFEIEGEVEVPKAFGNAAEAHEPFYLPAIEEVRRVVRSLRVFQSGSVGCDVVNYTVSGFCPFDFAVFGGAESPPPGRAYDLKADEVDDFVRHVELESRELQAAMAIACSRLADAEARTKPADRLLDAVIGMEALLLAALRDAEFTGELRYRFSLHYSTLFDTPNDRLNAFRLAKDLYGHRCTLAHGSRLPDNERFREAADQACESLRRLIKHFLPMVGNPYTDHGFWERRYFGLES